MHVISRRRLKEAAAKHADLEVALDTWYRVVKSAVWKSIDDVRRVYPHADYVNGLTVFNIKGNQYRLIAKMEYRWEKAFIRTVLTHAEHNEGGWK